ncbi:hypothetical protein QBC38DRAFT_214788 [Podospora fimiseda]|uniref:Ketohexokinase n=1 Tax=Podospora fimiseda TaxID=252190 RepID=A0AAN7BPS2_9PEZI|nr:hypothetical protein QBC38DRAFT_214788 [Podospora fimiseda]
MKHLILIGACYLDTILTVPQFPEEDSKLRATDLQVRRGGNCPNSLQVLQQLLASGHHRDVIKCHLISCFPGAGTAATRKILSSFGEHESDLVDFTHCLYREGHDEPASSYIIRSTESASRTIVNYNDLPEMTIAEFQDIVRVFMSESGTQDGNGSWWHFEGRIPETTLQCIRHLRRVTPKGTISVEVEKPNRKGLVEIAAEADVVFYSRTWAESRGYSGPEACLRGEAESSQATIGAGDTFIAGALYALHIEGWDLKAKLAYAVALATKKVQMEGFAGLTLR